MVFSSLTFLFVFFPLFLITYYLAPDKTKNFVLFAFSMVFYAWGEPIYILLMVFSTVFDYTNGRLIEKFGPGTKKAKIVMINAVIVNLGLLGVFKYSNLVVDTINNILNTNIPWKELPLPIGISFYTFQTLSYSIDVYLGKAKAQHNIINFGAYVVMFPQLIAGPIVQYKTIDEQLNSRKVTLTQVYNGVLRFMEGFIKKVFLANSIGFVWSEVLANYHNLSTPTMLLGLICYSMQIYFDFSGYSDMAIGLGKMMGFEFLENFNYPYISKSLTEFWRRWHISLGTWFREYVYIPLGGNRKGLKRQIINVAIVWLLTGIWHGAAYNYILWGVYYGILLIIEKMWLLDRLKKLPAFVQHAYSLFFVLFGWALFAIEDFSVLGNFFNNLFQFNFSNDILYYLSNFGVLILVGLTACTPVFAKLRTKLEKKGAWVHVYDIATVGMFILSLAMLVNSTYNPFLYFRF